MRKIIQLSLLALLISACTLEKPKKSSVDHRMEELNDSLSYAIGLDMGMRMELEYKDINHKMNMLSLIKNVPELLRSTLRKRNQNIVWILKKIIWLKEKSF